MGRGDDARTRSSALAFTTQADASAGATRADGSTVDVDSESAKLADNALEQQAAVQVAHARIEILKAAMGGAALMSMFGGLEISASGLTAERLRMDVTAENLANAQTTRGADGQPYRRKEVVLQEVAGVVRRVAVAAAMGGSGASQPGGVQVAGDRRGPRPPLKRVYDPGHPDADAQGYVPMPNVDTVTEMVDLISAQRAYEANVTAMQAAKQMFSRTLELLR